MLEFEFLAYMLKEIKLFPVAIRKLKPLGPPAGCKYQPGTKIFHTIYGVRGTKHRPVKHIITFLLTTLQHSL